jgi:hypothetical protein
VALAAPVTEQELADYWPGGSENPDSDLGAWLYCWARLHAFLERTRQTETSEEDQIEAERAALKAFRDEPVIVELVRPVPPIGQYLAVHPKSFDSLTLLESIEHDIRALIEQIEWLERRWESQALDKLPEFLQALTTAELCAVWVCCHEGPGTPFGWSEVPELPAWLRRLDPLDIPNIMQAHHEVDRKRIELIASGLRKRGGESQRFSWATLGIQAASSTGTPIGHLYKGRSLGSWFTEVALKWDGEAAARERAEGKTKNGGLPLESVLE